MFFQRVYQVATDAFTASTEMGPRVAALNELRELMGGADTRTLAGDGIHPSQLFGKLGLPTFVSIYKTHDFTMDLIAIPKHKSLPLHNHPGMYVVGKILSGKVTFHYQSCADW